MILPTAITVDTLPAGVLQRRDPSQLRPHADAALIPQMTPDEYDALVEDVERRGITDPLVVTDDVVLDGRHRLMAAKVVGLETVPVREFKGDTSEQLDLMLRAALLRRHLTTAQRKALAAKLIVAEPARSNRSIAKATAISRPTVAKIRDDLQVHDQVAEVATSTGADGKTYPRPAALLEEPDHREVEVGTDYDDLFAHADDPKVRYRLGEKLNREKVDGAYPKGRLKAIAKQYDTTVRVLKEHVTDWEAAVSSRHQLERTAEHAAMSFELDGWVIGGGGTVAELIPAVPAEERRKLRAALRKGVKRIEKMIEALR